MNFDSLEKHLKSFRLPDNQISGILDFIRLNDDVRQALESLSPLYLAASFTFNIDIPDLEKVNKKKINEELEKLLEIINNDKRITENQLLTQKFEIISYSLLIEKLKAVEETEDDI